MSDWQSLSDDFLQGVENRGLSVRTYRFYRNCLKPFVAFATDNDLDPRSFKLADWNAYLTHLRGSRTLKDSSLHAMSRGVRVFFSYLLDAEVIDALPRIKMPRVKRKQPRGLTDQELEKVRAACKNLRDRLLVEFGLATGMRAAEVLAVKWRDLSFDETTGRGYVRNIKEKGGGTDGRAYFKRPVWELLQQYRTELFPGNADNPATLDVALIHCYPRFGWLSYAGLQRAIRDIGKEAGLPLHYHMLRHTFALRLARKKKPKYIIQELLRHLTPNQTDWYVKVTDDMAEDSYFER